MTPHIPPRAHRHGHRPSWQMDTNFWLWGIWAGDFMTGRKTQFLLTPPAFGTLTGWSHQNFIEIFSIMRLSCGIVFADPTFSHFDTILACERQTDGRTHDDSKYGTSTASHGQKYTQSLTNETLPSNTKMTLLSFLFVGRCCHPCWGL